jgi:hypothetical protein
MILRSFYNGAFSIASKHDFDGQFFFFCSRQYLFYKKYIIMDDRGIFIFGGGNKRLRIVTKMYCQCQICHKRRKKKCIGKFKLSLN